MADPLFDVAHEAASLELLDYKYASVDAAHRCGQSLCCNPEHLFWQDHSENARWQPNHWSKK